MKVLIVKTSSLGDIIQSFPVLTYLKHKFPRMEIDWIVERPFAELAEAHPLVRKVWKMDSKRWRKSLYRPFIWKEMLRLRKAVNAENYDLVFDLQGNLKSGLLLSQIKCKEKVGFGWNTVHEKCNVLFTNKRFESLPGVNIREDYLSLPKAYFGDKEPFVDGGVVLTITPEQEFQVSEILKQPKIDTRQKVMVCPGSAWDNKQVDLESLSDFLFQLQQKTNCAFLYIWGTEYERQLCERLHKELPQSILVDRLKLPVLQNLMAKVDLVIAMDSLPLHLAGTTATKTFSVFGSSRADKFKPVGLQHLSLQGTCPYGKTFPKRCPILRTCKTGACIKSFSGNQLMERFRADS